VDGADHMLNGGIIRIPAFVRRPITSRSRLAAANGRAIRTRLFSRTRASRQVQIIPVVRENTGFAANVWVRGTTVLLLFFYGRREIPA